MLRRNLLGSLLVLAPGALTLACKTTVIEERAPPGPAISRPVGSLPVGSLPVDAPCLADGDACDQGGEACCADLFCADTGYGHGTCRPLQPTGGYCGDDAQCQSGICNVGACVDELPACVDLGQWCAGGAPCCEGYCVPNGYAPEAGTCVPAQPEGAPCAHEDQCESGLCELGVCRAADCSDTGASCFDDGACCGGFCSGSAYSYAPGKCTMPQEAGAYCQTWMWCASMSCVESVCAP